MKVISKKLAWQTYPIGVYVSNESSFKKVFIGRCNG